MAIGNVRFILQTDNFQLWFLDKNVFCIFTVGVIRIKHFKTYYNIISIISQALVSLHEGSLEMSLELNFASPSFCIRVHMIKHVSICF